ncbi:MAG: hypothetical protein M3P40_02170 [Actinomycetota bacterium]|nr:hypothetical protein [Actinomycetota bacterium]
MQLVDAHLTDAGTINVTLNFGGRVKRLEGSVEETNALCAAMRETALLATVSDNEDAWLSEVRMGDDAVRFGLKPGGVVALAVTPAS